MYTQAQKVMMQSAVVIPEIFGQFGALLQPNLYPRVPVYWMHPELGIQWARVWIKR